MNSIAWVQSAKELLNDIANDDRVINVPDTTCRCCRGQLEEYSNKDQLINVITLAVIEKLRKQLMSELLDIDIVHVDKSVLNELSNKYLSYVTELESILINNTNDTKTT